MVWWFKLVLVVTAIVALMVYHPEVWTSVAIMIAALLAALAFRAYVTRSAGPPVVADKT